MPVYREFRGISYVDFPSEYCLVDIETTGLSPLYDNIIEIGAIRYTSGRITEQFQTLVQPPCSKSGMFIDDFIVQLTGITNEMLFNAPKACVAIRDFAEFLGDDVIVGYNVSFDVNFLYDNYMKHMKRPLTNNFIDVLRMARRLCTDLPSNDLDSVMHHFDIKVDNRHRAIGDCIATEQVYRKLQEEALNSYGTLQDFSKTFKAYRVQKPEQIEIELDTFEEWKHGLYTCSSVYKAFKFFERLNLKKVQLIKFAEYLGVSFYKYVDKHGIISKIVYSTAGEKLKDDPVRKRNIEKYKKDTANNGVVFILSLRGDTDADNSDS